MKKQKRREIKFFTLFLQPKTSREICSKRTLEKRVAAHFLDSILEV